MAKDTELDAILDPDILSDEYLIDEETGLPIKDQGQKTTGQKLSEDSLKFLADTAAIAQETVTAPPGLAVGLFNALSSINNAPKVPNPLQIGSLIRELTNFEYNLAPKSTTVGAYVTGALAGELAYFGALNKIKSSSPTVYQALTKMFPYSVGQLHTAAIIGAGNVGEKKKSKVKRKKGESKSAFRTRKKAAEKVGKFAKFLGGVKGVLANVIPNPATRPKMMNNFFKIGKAGLAYSVLAPYIKEAFTTSSLGDGTITGQQDAILKSLFNADSVERIYDDFTGVTTYRLVGGESDGFIMHPEMFESFVDAGMAIREADKKQMIIDAEKFDKDFQRAPLIAFRRYLDTETGKSSTNSKVGMIFNEIKKNFGNIYALEQAEDIFETGPDRVRDDGIYDIYSQSEQGLADDAKDKALNEQYMQEKLNQGQAPFVTDPNAKLMGMSTGGILETLRQNDPDKKLRESGQLPPLQEFTSDQILEQANVFEDPSLPEFETANLFGKVPLWAVQNIDKFKMLTQKLSNAEKKQLEALEKKVGTVEEVNLSSGALDDSVTAVSDDVGTAVVKPKTKKEIIDSPEGSESIFYSNLEARLMDPNTPPVFNSVDQFYKFMQNKGISKPEIEDNILTSYLNAAAKQNKPISKQAMLAIVRQAPQRKIETVTYGFGGNKPAKYPGYQESGAIDGTYREEVLFLNPKAIPGDPDQLPGSAHDFTERYVIGWSRLTDRDGTIPGAEGLFTTADKKMLATLKKNQTKLDNQLKGLETSAYEKIRRQLDGDLTPSDQMGSRMISETIDSRMTFLEEIDKPLANQIRQFKSKMQDDLVKIQNLEKIQAGSKVRVTFADEIQSDILQQAKKLELDLKEQISDLMDLPLNERMARLARDRLSYRGKAREVEPQVLEYYTRNETIFRPMFKTAEDMQQFIDEFRLNKKIFTDLAKSGPSPEPQLLASAKKAAAIEKKMLEELDVGLSDAALKQLFPNVPFKNRMEWGSALIKRDIAQAAKKLFIDKDPNASQWYAVTPAKFVKNRYSQKGGTNTPINERTSDMKGIGTEEFYGGPTSTDFKGKHYTSTVEKILKRAAKDNNSEFKIIEVNGVGEVFAIKITPEMLLPHKTHRKRGGLVYTPESIIDIFEAA